MWWWQSVAFAGALVLAISVPVDHGTLTWACAGCAPATPAAARGGHHRQHVAPIAGVGHVFPPWCFPLARYRCVIPAAGPLLPLPLAGEGRGGGR